MREDKSAGVVQNFALYVLGAGFSRPAGLPLANELWAEILGRAQRMSGRAAQFVEDLDYYRKYKKRCDGIDLAAMEVNFEEFLAFLDIEFHLGLRGSDTWSQDGNEAQVIVKTLIGEILTESMPSHPPELYLKFAAKLQPGDLVLTFNYDCLLEKALDAIKKPYRLFPHRYKEIRQGSASIDDRRDEVIVFKLHGSTDWFDRSSFDRMAQLFREQGASILPNDPIFHPDSGTRTTPLVDGPRHENDPLKNLHRVQDEKRTYGKHLLFRATPFLVPPSTSKILWFEALKDFWWGMNNAGSLSFRMAVIGFSMSPHDDYARQVLYTLVRNYQHVEWGNDVFGRTKTPLLLVDLRETESDRNALLQRYAFVDWTRARTHFEGFDDRAVSLL